MPGLISLKFTRRTTNRASKRNCYSDEAVTRSNERPCNVSFFVLQSIKLPNYRHRLQKANIADTSFSRNHSNFTARKTIRARFSSNRAPIT